MITCGCSSSLATAGRGPRCGAASSRRPATSSSCRTPTSSTTRRVPPAAPADRRGQGRRRLRLAVHRREHRVLYFWHSVGNKFLTLLSNMFTNLNLTDMETCYKVFRREVIQGITLEERPVRVRARGHGQDCANEAAHLRGRHLVLRPHLRRRQEDRLAGRLQSAVVHLEVHDYNSAFLKERFSLAQGREQFRALRRKHEGTQRQTIFPAL